MTVLTDDQKREMTERIIAWMGWEKIEAVELPHLFSPSHWRDKDDCRYSIHFYPLDSRDDWALVEEESEKRGLWDQYIKGLVNRFDPLYLVADKVIGPQWIEDARQRTIAGQLRHAHPTVCAMAWDQMVNEVK